MTEEQLNLPIAELPPLDEEERLDAAFRGKDLGWSAIARLFDHYRRTENLTYSALGERIHRPRSQVQRWIASPFGMNLSTLGILAEGLNADLRIEVVPRTKSVFGANYCHPREAAKSIKLQHLYLTEASSPTVAANSVNKFCFDMHHPVLVDLSDSKLELSDG